MSSSRAGTNPQDPYLEDKPCLIVEVLSPHTALTARWEKLIAYRIAYRKLLSLHTHLIVDQDGKTIERHYRDQGSRWLSEVIDEGGVLVPCPSRTDLTLADIYEGLWIRTARDRTTRRKSYSDT